ncbi:hypothetical protein [Cryptosporangium aurantiacum]|uniref:Uncharacterized protein n=1 Tax=Cryptosporangium aurantiacum TaxID=134849 RepID=A0A1M7PC52_9ACTN|nr:hypothetical protein [Cryptosporangium aurantiacum]SHN14445.1 hypothetical protein SAMN05443668_103188 [Cryptosporangium aurantiacum]
MTWIAWLALVVAQLVVVWVALFLLFRDLPNSLFLSEKLICLVLGLGLLAVDGAVLFGFAGPGWPVPARYSLVLLGLAAAAWLLNDAVYLSVKGPDVPHAMGVAVYPGYDVRARHRRRIAVRLGGLVVAAMAVFWLLSAA